jgi:hypothetical protein
VKKLFCQEPGCGKRLRSSNKFGYCIEHRQAAERARLRAKLAEAERIIAAGYGAERPTAPRGRPRDKDTSRKLELMAKLSLQGKSLRAMSAEVYPERKHSPTVAYNNVRWLASNYRAEFEAAKRRLQGA